MRPILCIFGILTNGLTLIAVKNTNRNQVKHLKTPMYKHITINAYLNIIFCSINILSLMNICIFPKSSFCSSILQDETSQLVKIYAILFGGNVLRLCCNFSYIAFSLSRFISATSQKNRLKDMNENLNFKLFYGIICVTSVIFSIFKMFESKVNEIYSSYDKHFPYNAYDIRYCEDLNENIDVSTSLKFKCKLFATLNLINNILNNVLFLLVNVLLDFLMIRFSNKVIEKKKSLNCPHLNEAMILKEKLNKIIITNGIVFFLAHFPEFIVTILLIAYEKRLARFCFNYFACTDLIEMAQTFHLFSICLQFYILHHFDRNINESFADRVNAWFKKKNSKTQS